MAEDTGPDLFLVHNTWVDKYLPKILPAPKSVKTAVQVSGGGAGPGSTSAVYQVVVTPTISLRTLRNDFADVAARDSVRNVNVSTDPGKITLEERVLALPLSVDTLALYLNKDLLNAAGIPTPPDTWDQFQAQVKRLARQDDQGKIIRAGAGIGLGTNVERAPDIISLLMMQNQAQMAADNGYPMFARVPPDLSGQRNTPPGLEALRFYSEFANPAKDVYTWNADQPNSLDAFIRGTSAFFLGYSYHLPTIRARAPKINLGITGAPQIAGNAEANFANYWLWTVSKKTKSPDLAWQLVNFMAGKTEVAKYLAVTKRPAALKSLLEGQLENEDAGVFASQVLTARSWYRGKDPRATDTALAQMLDVAPSAADDNALLELLRIAEEKVAQTVR
jgi:ABC-type glycerol-3-phosphate transport system substrate-binding protein